MSIDMSQARTASNPTPVVDPTPAHEKSIGELFADLTRESSTLIRQEVNLAKAEVKDKMTVLAKDAVKIAAGGALAYAGLIVLLMGFGFLLAQWIWPWLAFVLVGAVVAGVGGFLAFSAINGLKNSDLAPRQTVETLKEDAQWAKQQIHR
jgi:fatty acid desaturase